MLLFLNNAYFLVVGKLNEMKFIVVIPVKTISLSDFNVDIGMIYLFNISL